MGYAARFSPAAKQAERRSEWRRVAQHIKDQPQFETMLAAYPKADRRAVLDLTAPMLSFELVPSTFLESIGG